MCPRSVIMTLQSFVSRLIFKFIMWSSKHWNKPLYTSCPSKTSRPQILHFQQLSLYYIMHLDSDQMILSPTLMINDELIFSEFIFLTDRPAWHWFDFSLIEWGLKEILCHIVPPWTWQKWITKTISFHCDESNRNIR